MAGQNSRSGSRASGAAKGKRSGGSKPRKTAASKTTAAQKQAATRQSSIADPAPTPAQTDAKPAVTAPTAVAQGFQPPPSAGHDGPRTGDSASAKREASAAAPLDTNDGDRRPPVEAQRHLSTSPVAAAAGQRSLVGQGSLGLVDEEGNDLDPDSIFDSGDGTQTFVTTKVRVYEKVVPQGARTPTTRLLFPQNAKVPRDKADLFVTAAKSEAKQPLNEAAGRERMGSDGTKAAAASR